MHPSDSSQNESDGDFMKAPQKMGESFGNVLANNPQQDPQRVANVFAELIDKPYGEKPFRAIVDFIGMGDHEEKYNDHLEQVTQGLYGNFGIADKLSVKK